MSARRRRPAYLLAMPGVDTLSSGRAPTWSNPVQSLPEATSSCLLLHDTQYFLDIFGMEVREALKMKLLDHTLITPRQLVF